MPLTKNDRSRVSLKKSIRQSAPLKKERRRERERRKRERGGEERKKERERGRELTTHQFEDTLREKSDQVELRQTYSRNITSIRYL